MDQHSRLISRIGRLLGMVCLFLGLASAGRLTGVWNGGESPLQALGMMGFIYLAVFTLAQLFAAVGLWIETSWGGVVLVGAMATELLLLATGNSYISMSVGGIVVRVLLLLGALAMLAYTQRHLIDRVHD